MRRFLLIVVAALALASTAQAGWVQLPAPNPDAGFVQIGCPSGTTDRTCPAARKYAKRMLARYVRRGILAAYLPAWNEDPAHAWRVVSGMYAAAQRGCTNFGQRC